MAELKKVLIVDDEKFVTETLEVFLKTKGYRIFKAIEGRAAVEIIKNETLDLVLLDIKLPNIDGIEILKLIRQDYPQTKVIVMTAYDMEYKNKIDKIGCDAFFIKPLFIDELTSTIDDLLSKGESSRRVEQKPEGTQQAEQKIPVSGANGILPQARILIVSSRILIADLLKEYFSKREICKGIYDVAASGIEQIEYIKKIQPDIVLLDIAWVGMLGEFGLTLMKLPQPPREIILFGDPSMKWDEVEALIKRGTKFIEMPFDLDRNGFPTQETIQRLNKAVREVCLRYGLYKGGSDG